MSIWLPSVPVQSNLALQLNRGNPCAYTYTLQAPQLAAVRAGAIPTLTLSDDSGVVLSTWNGTLALPVITIVAPPTTADLIPAGTSWTLIVTNTDASVVMLAQGTVIRVEAPFPNLAPTNVLEGVNFDYTFATAGALSDPTWNVLAGTPVVYDNSSMSLPNAVAAGSPEEWILNGDVTVASSTGNPWSKVAMLYFAPLPSDAVSLSYNVIKGFNIGGGQTYIVVSSSIDMNTCVAFYHEQWLDGSPNTVGIATGSGPTANGNFTTWDVQASIEYTTVSQDNFIATYNPVNNTYALFLFGDTSPLVTWTDETNLIPHGSAAYRYAGFVFDSDALNPGVEISDWYMNQNVTFTATQRTQTNFVADATYIPATWANTVDLVGVGGGGGSEGETLVGLGNGGCAGAWASATLTVGATGALGLKAGGTITITVGQGGAGGPYFTPGVNGTATTFSWPDAAGTTQTLTCPGGFGGQVLTNLTSWGLSPGNLTYDGATFEGGAVNQLGGVGNAPGGGGAGALEFQYGQAGATGEAWVVDRAYINPAISLDPQPPAGTPGSTTYVANSTFTIDSWAATVALVGVGGGGGSEGETLVGLGNGGCAGAWNSTTLTVGQSGATGIKAGGTITVVVGTGGAGGPYFTPGVNGTATTFSWLDASNAPQTLTCPGGFGGQVTTNLTSWGLSPGNLTYGGVDYVGGALNYLGGPGNSPGGGGAGALEFQYGQAGALGQAWIAETA